MEALERAVDELYGLALEDFVPRRDAIARELRAAGDRDVAAAVRKLVKPSVAAWAVNQLARERPDELRGLLDAGAELRRVQEWLLRREADPHDLRAAVDRERAAVGGLTRAARELLEAAGRRAGPAVLERVGETLHAAAADDDVRDLVERGRLAEDRAAIGIGSFAGAGPPSVSRPKRPAPRRADPDAAEPDSAGDARRRAERDAKAAAGRALEEAESVARAAASRRTAADHEAQRAHADLVTAQARMADAEAALDASRARLADAQRAAAEAGADADAAEAEAQRLRDGG
ncbi:MAG: hypothetical protein QOJ07_350 [Thermoleophilaceae bacterium]|nr:hypothetical protein [Thermoleophilaceae bacterium]